jgi:hypothetical protein
VKTTAFVVVFFVNFNNLSNMKKNIITILTVVILIFIMKRLVDYVSSNEFNDSILKKISMQGRIVKLKGDFNSHHVPVAILRNGETMNINFVFQKLAIGDSIIKKKGTTYMTIIRKDSVFRLNLSQPGISN